MIFFVLMTSPTIAVRTIPVIFVFVCIIKAIVSPLFIFFPPVNQGQVQCYDRRGTVRAGL